MSQLNVLVTGGSGYIGSTLVPLLLKGGHYVTVYDNLMYGQTPGLDLFRNRAFLFEKGDVTDYQRVGTLIKDYNAVVWLAAIVGAPACAQSPLVSYMINVESVREMLGHLAPDVHVVYPNTNSGYGIMGDEDACTEESPMNPISLYGKQKCEAESLIKASDHTWTIHRLATVFGMSPRMRLDLLVNDFVWQAINYGVIKLFEPYHRRNFVHVYDVARAIVASLTQPHISAGRVYNIGNDACNMTKRDLADRIVDYLPGTTIVHDSSRKDPDQRDYIVSSTRVTQELGWIPEHMIEDGIEELIEGYKAIGNRLYYNV